MSNKSSVISIGLLVVLVLSLGSEAEGTELFQRFYSSKLALETKKWTFSNNGLKYQMAKEPDVNICTLEFLGGTLAGYGCGCILGVIFDNVIAPFEPSILIVVSAMVGTSAVSSACGVEITAKKLRQDGSFWYALTGAAIGGVISMILAFMPQGALLLPTLPLFTSLGAVIGYNL